MIGLPFGTRRLAGYLLTVALLGPALISSPLLGRCLLGGGFFAVSASLRIGLGAGSRHTGWAGWTDFRRRSDCARC